MLLAREIESRFLSLPGTPGIEWLEQPRSLLKRKSPNHIKNIGGPTHLMFEELVVRAETDDMDTLTSFSGQLVKQYLGYHIVLKQIELSHIHVTVLDNNLSFREVRV